MVVGWINIPGKELRMHLCGKQLFFTPPFPVFGEDSFHKPFRLGITQIQIRVAPNNQ